MELDEIRNAFLGLHGEVTELLSEVRHMRFQWTLIIRPGQLRKMENRFAALSQRFDVLDAQLIHQVKLPKDFDAFRTTATFDLFSAVREAVRANLSETQAAIGSLRSQANYQRSRAVIVIGLALAIGLAVAIVALFV